ncbi:Disease resistance protein [Melia azedarach]|uniref:Disease resistance protein n=1 Tax=Melia azedarach TaxID=155640 RepID=A0ACC1YFJ7_MELAZ|nr:Disease resistance protein [Melia azedarach]
MRCFKGLCPDLKTRYQISKEVVMLLQTVDKHQEVGNFNKISYPIIPKDPRLSIKDYEAFESRRSTLTNVVRSLSNPDVKIVGIYGMGGIGKTTLAKEVANQTETNILFDSVIFVEVTQDPDIMKTQKEIAEKLGLKLSQDETESTRAGKLYQRLKKEKKILIILDNIWANLDLQAVGIPLEDEHKGCKVLLTARSVDLLSHKMGSQRNFPVHLLCDDEAWSLFKKMTGDYIEGKEFKSVATEVANKCARLPIVIVTIARALANKPLFVWKDVLQQMAKSSSENVQAIHASIELSYKYLESEVLKKTILLIRYANLTSIDELLMYGMGMGLFDGINKMEGRRVRVQTLVQQLKDSCLLLDSNTTGEDFSMHDIVRDVVILIASRDRHVFTNELSHELEWPDENTLKAFPSIVLKDIFTNELPHVLECQQLKFLSISLGYSDLIIHDEFFRRVTELKVLVLANIDSWSLPSSLCSLTNLRALGLHNCRLKNIAIVGDLKKLEILSLKNSMIPQLPVEVCQLTQLKSLDIRSYFCLADIPANVISSLYHLEELYMGDFKWKKEGLNKNRENFSLHELEHLPNLTSLEIEIEHANALPKDLFFKKLERYKIAIGSSWDWDSDKDWNWDFTSPESYRKFKLKLLDTNICLKEGHIMQLKGIEDLYLVGLQDMKNVLYGLDKDGFPQLKYLRIRDNANLLYIVDSMEYGTANVFPILESLLIRNLVNLEKICRSKHTIESSFSQLRKIKVESCDKLKNIFSFSIVRRLQLLQSIDVIDCMEMEIIFAIEKENESDSNSEVIANIELSQLRSLTLTSLPQLRSFYSLSETPSSPQQRQNEIILVNNINVSTTLFTGEVVLPNLEVLELHEINVERIWQNQVAVISSSTQNLTTLILRHCNNLRCLFPSSVASSFLQLQYLEISKFGMSCNLKKVCSGDFIGFPSLKQLEMWTCPKLKEFTVKNMSTNDDLTEIPLSFFNKKDALPNLEILIIDGCNNLKYLFSSSTVRSLVRLQDLQIFNCQVLEVIFDLEGLNFEEEHNPVLTQLRRLDIDSLPNLKHIWNKDPQKFLSYQKLITVSIVECDRLKNVFPASIASSLSQLESLGIRKCGVEEIVSIAYERVETNLRLVFPRGMSLTLEDLPNFTKFFPGRYTTEWPVLKKLKLMNLSLQELNEEQPQFLVEKLFPKLEELTLIGKGVEIIWHFPEALFCKLKYLDVQLLDKSTVFLSLDFLQRFHSMKRVTIEGDLFASNIKAENGMSAMIKNINVCSDLKHILKEESNVDHLVHLQVFMCENLINLVPSSTSFRSLTTLEDLLYIIFTT